MINSAHENYSSHLMTHWKVLLRPVSLLCGLTQPTPADTFLLREKYPKAYLRGFPLDIPWGRWRLKQAAQIRMMRRHHENRISFDFPRDGKQNQFTFLTKTIPSRSNRKAVTLPLIYHKSFMIHRGDRRGNSPFCRKSKNQKVFGVSLVTFFTQESYRGVERVAPQRNRLAETSLWGRV